MTKLSNFLKTNFIVAKWTVAYFFVLWAILWYLFKFDMFSNAHWWRFFHAHLHGFVGLVFGLLMYAAIPLYIATTAIIYRTKAPLFTFPFIEKIKENIKKLFTKPEPETNIEPEQPEITEEEQFQYPENLPTELRAPFIRMKQRLSLTGMTSSFNKTQTDSQLIASPQPTETEPDPFPIPTNFDIGDSLPDTSVPTFTDIDFDTPKQPSPEIKTENSVTKYFTEHNIEFETFNDFVITDKCLIYIHNDPDFWILDKETWFAAGKQIDSPIPVMLELSKENNLTPIIYFESTNIMDFDGTKKHLNENGIKTITDISELD